MPHPKVLRILMRSHAVRSARLLEVGDEAGAREELLAARALANGVPLEELLYYGCHPHCDELAEPIRRFSN